MRARRRSPETGEVGEGSRASSGSSGSNRSGRSDETLVTQHYYNSAYETMANNRRFLGVLEELSSTLEEALVRSSVSFGQIGTTLETLFTSFSFASGISTSIPFHIKKAIRDALGCCLSASRTLAKEHRENHIYISRLGRAIDNDLKCPMKSGLELERQRFFLSEGYHLINLEILHCLLTNGYNSVIPHFLKESKLEENVFLKNKLDEFVELIDHIKSENPIPIFEWINEQDNEFDYSDLKFHLHKIIFCQTAVKEGDGNAINYARENFSQFSSSHEEDIAQLMISLVIGMESELKIVGGQYWNDVLETFIKCASRILRFREKNELLAVINTGCEVIPQLMEMKERLEMTPLRLVENIKCLTKCHSLFACPILKELCTEDNPPMRLQCGHVISKAALNRLTFNQRLKCPYCPVVQKRDDAKRVYF